MIFVTVGTHHQPFPRLIDALAGLPGGDVVVQHGHSRSPPGVREAVAFLPFPELMDRLNAADVVVTHAGVGSILLARRSGHTPVVVPRRRRFGEHVDDHQVELAQALAKEGKVLAVTDTAQLAATVRASPRRTSPRGLTEGGLHRAVRAALG